MPLKDSVRDELILPELVNLDIVIFIVKSIQMPTIGELNFGATPNQVMLKA